MNEGFTWILIVGVLLGKGLEAQEEAAVFSRLPYIQNTTTTSAVIVWRTVGLQEPVVRVGLDVHQLVREFREGRVLYPAGGAFGEDGEDLTPLDDEEREWLFDSPNNVYQYEWTLTDLEPDTAYFYAIDVDGLRLIGGDELHTVRTSPPREASRPLRFWVVGDTGSGNDLQRMSFQAMQEVVAATGRPVDASLHLGDMAYNDGADWEFQAHFFDIYARMLRHTVTWPTMGNHEGHTASGVSARGPYFDAYVLPKHGEAGGAPSGTESYYAFDYGPIHFVCLNSHDLDRSPHGVMAQWLREDLNRVQSPWLIAFFHHPPYSKGTHDSDREYQLAEMRTHIMPILEAYGVDLVLAGHSHTYERSMLIDGAYATPTVVDGVVLDDGDGDPDGHGPYRKSAGLRPHEGTVAVVAGHGRGAVQHYGFMPVMRRTVPEAGSFLLDLEGDRLTGYMINFEGKVRDRFQMIKAGTRGEPERQDYPWRPHGPRVTTALLGEGFMKITLAPDPPAPDAVVRYTLDGSPVTADSPIYIEPLVVSQDVYVTAQATWREGARVSPSTVTGWLRVRDPHQVYIPIASGDDDGVVVEGRWQASGNVIDFESDQTALRFLDVRIPREAIIARAYLQFTSARPDTRSARATIQVERALDSAPLLERESLLDRRWSDEAVAWDIPLWPLEASTSTSQRSPDLSNLLQALIAEEGWESGGALTFRLQGEGPRQVVAFEGRPSRSATLVVAYEVGSPLEVAVSQPPLVQQYIVGNATRTQVAYRRLTGYAGDGLTYVLESSSDLSPGSWRPATEWEPVELPILEGSWQFATFQRLGPLSGTEFVRFRVTEQ